MINPYTGVLEEPQNEPDEKKATNSYRDFVGSKFPDVEYLELEEVQDDVRIIDNDDNKSKMTSRKVWQDTNRDEWWNIYETYMKSRAERKSPVRTQRRYNARWHAKRTRAPLKREYPQYVRDPRSDQNEDSDSKQPMSDSPTNQGNPQLENLLCKEEIQEEDALVSLPSEYYYEAATAPLEEPADVEEYGEVEYLSEEECHIPDVLPPPVLSLPRRPRGLGRPPDYRMQYALEAVHETRLTPQLAARHYRVPLEALCNRLQRITPASDKPKDVVMRKEKFFEMQGNTLILLHKSNICIFRYRNKKFLCFMCNVSFDNMALLRRHTRKRHTFSKLMQKLREQRFSYNRADISNLQCRLCNQSLDNLEELYIHLKKHGVKFPARASTLMPFKLAARKMNCQFCFTEFGNVGLLFKHMNRHYIHCICNVCCMAFPNAHALKLHRYHMHTPAECRLCGVKLKNVHAKKKHEVAIHGIKKGAQPKFKCTFCPEYFVRDYLRIKHILEEHNGNRTLNKCDFCPKMFITAHWCTRHMNCVHKHEQDALLNESKQ